MKLPPIYSLSWEPTAGLATSELQRCLRAATGAECWDVCFREYIPGVRAVWLGLYSHFPEDVSAGRRDSHASDEYTINIGPNGGFIAASNCRSILFGAYRYLTELGFRWVRPGEDGELVPDIALPLPTVRLTDSASYRHRGICIEGAVSDQHVRDMVDWLPKLGFNAYFIQFREAYNFFQRWYEHVGNPRLKKRKFTLEKARELTQEIRADIKERGLELHMVGHGWTCEPFGIPGTGWFPHEGPIPRKAKPHLAELDGERKLFGEIALNTNLCYGNSKTRQIIIDAITDYAKENADVDIIHFWLADGSNNQCECRLCRPHRPAALYVRMLNDVDAELTRQGIATRIVFLVYVDLLWPPVKAKIQNPDRFILMFAPITRSYSEPFAADSGRKPKLPPYERNKLAFPRDPKLNLAFLSKWQRMFRGESFDFDYHFMWDHYKDPGYYSMARVLHQDLQHLHSIGLDGFVSCQVQRAFFPTGLGMAVLGRTLWDRSLSFESIARDYFRSAYGENGAAARRYCAEISKLFDPPLIRGEASERQVASAPRKLAKVGDAIAKIAPTIEHGKQNGNPVHAASWRYLEAHTELALLFANALSAKCKGESEEAKARTREMFDWARRNETKLHPVFDVFEFQWTVGPLLGIDRAEVS